MECELARSIASSFADRTGSYTSGRAVGDYTVEVLNRIPPEIFSYVAAAPGRMIKLIFRIKNDGVLLAWEVQETSPGGHSWVFKMHGGDF